MTSSHREYSFGFLDNNQPLILIDNLNVTALERLLVTLSLTDGNLHTRLQLEVKLTHSLTINFDTPTLQSRLYLCTTLLHIL